MNKKPKYWNRALKYLSSKDSVMKTLIKKYNDKTLTTRKDIFFSLCKSIIGQQISVAAANSVFLKFKKTCKGKITPVNVNKKRTSELKKCGLSRQKVKGIKELSKKFLNKEFNPNLINNMSDEEAIIYLSSLTLALKSAPLNVPFTEYSLFVLVKSGLGPKPNIFPSKANSKKPMIPRLIKVGMR